MTWDAAVYSKEYYSFYSWGFILKKYIYFFVQCASNTILNVDYNVVVNRYLKKCYNNDELIAEGESDARYKLIAKKYLNYTTCNIYIISIYSIIIEVYISLCLCCKISKTPPAPKWFVMQELLDRLVLAPSSGCLVTSVCICVLGRWLIIICNHGS